MSQSIDILFASHGGGPLPLLGDPGHADMVASLRGIASGLVKPTAILVISAHWEEAVPTVTSGPSPELIYDYYGFPKASYSIRYPCPGEPELADRVHRALTTAGMDCHKDDRRGFDHGLFVPLKIMFPEADIPCLQLSLVKGLDADVHLAMGRALRNLDTERLLVLGSGFSFHNMQAFFAPATDDTRAMNRAFENWLAETCSSRDLTEEQRAERLSGWEFAPHARYCHPREEHLLPLHVCYGLAQKPCDDHWTVNILGKDSGTFFWSI